MSSLEYSWSYGELPLEIILHIYNYLGYSDLQTAGATCRRWHAALDQTEFNERTRVRFAKVVLSDHHSPAKDFLKCERHFRHFLFEDVSIGQVEGLMSHIGRTAHSLTLDNVDLNDKQFYGILCSMPKLRTLSVARCSPLFMSGTFLDGAQCNLNELAAQLAGIRELTLCENQYLTDAIFLRLTSLMPRLEVLIMSGCHIAFHNAIQRRFYPNDGVSVSAPSESVLTFKYILKVLTQQRAQLRELNFSHTLIGHSILALSDLDSDGNPNVQLKRLYLAGCRQLNVATAKSFLLTQSQLSVLDLSATICLNDDCLACIVLANPQLQHLKVNACAGITNTGAAQLYKLRRLKVLDISNCDGITSNGILEGVAREENNVLEELNVSYLQICEESIKAIACNLRALRVLHLNHCVNGVTDEAMQCIINHLRWLRELSLESCSGLTDVALTGINVSKLRSASQASSSNNFNPPVNHTLAERDSFAGSLQSIKISLRSKAEEEIVSDAKRKQAMFAAYEMNLIDEEDFEGHNIQQLRGLRSLNLRGCNKISDVSLKYGLKHVELKRLLLSNCQQISLLGMEALAANCPSIEELDLSDCYNINDKTIQVVTNKLRRLRSLHISGCSQLTDHTIDAILINCMCLQTLSVYRCRRMYTDIEERLSSVRTLRNVNMDNVASLDNVEFFRLKKRLDY